MFPCLAGVLDGLDHILFVRWSRWSLVLVQEVVSILVQVNDVLGQIPENKPDLIHVLWISLGPEQMVASEYAVTSHVCHP